MVELKKCFTFLYKNNIYCATNTESFVISSAFARHLKSRFHNIDRVANNVSQK